MSGINAQTKYLLMLSIVISGTLNTITYKFQNTSTVFEAGYPLNGGNRTFYHPYMQAVAMFSGEAICIIIYFIWLHNNKDEQKKRQEEALQKGQLIKVNYFKLIVPAAADLLTSTLQHIALVFISPSIYQMLRGGVVIITALASVLVLKRKLTFVNWLGCGLVLIGILIVGLQEFLLSNSNDDGVSNQTKAIAFLLIFISLFTDGVRYVSEELLFQKYLLHTYQLVGVEGCWGLLLYSILMPVLCLAPCHLSTTACVYLPNGDSRYESITDYFYEASHNSFLGVMCILGVFSILLFNLSGVTVTKYISCLVRSLIDVTRTAVVWLVGLIITWTGYKKWENTSIASILLQLLGFSIMIIGNLTYQEIIKWPCLQKYYRLKDELTDSATSDSVQQQQQLISMQNNKDDN